MKKLIFATMLLLMLITLQVQALTTREYQDRRSYIGSGNQVLDPLYELVGDVDDVLGTDGVLSITDIVFSNETSSPTATEGTLYYNATTEGLYIRNSGAWQLLATESGTVSLDVAYNNGNSIDVDGTAITFTVSDTDNNAALLVVQNDSTNDPDAMNITSAADAATAVGLQIDCTAGFDIQGTSDSWSVSIAGLFDGEGLTGVTNSQGILFDTNNEIQFGDNSEDVAMVFSENTMTWATDTGVAAMAFGVVDDLSGIASIAGDTGADFALSAANTGTYNFTITQAGVGDNELRLVSAGTAANAIALTASTGGITATSATSITGTSAAGAISLTSTGGDITLDASDKSIKLDSGEAGADDAIVIVTTGDGSGMQITSLADIDITTTGAADEDISITNTGGSIILSASEADASAISVQATAGGINIDAIGATAGDIDILAGDDMAIAATGALTVTGTTTAALTSPALTLGSTTTTASTVLQSGTGDLALTSTDDITLTVSTAVTDNIALVNTQGTAATAIAITATAGGITTTSAGSKIFDGAAAETWVIEGTANAHETSIVFTDPTADITWTFPAGTTDTLAVMGSTLSSNLPEVLNSVTGGSNTLVFEGAADAYEVTLTANDATADATISLPNDTGDVVYAPQGVVDYAAGSGALPTTHTIITYASQAGGEALTLADGKPGQILSVICDSDGGDGDISPATALGYTSVNLTADGDMVTFLFVDTQGWIVIGTVGTATVTP